MDIQKLIKEDNLNFGNKQFEKYIIEKYNLPDNYFDKSIYKTYYPIREVYVYSFHKNGTRRIFEHTGFIEYDDTDIANRTFFRRVYICLMDNRPNSRYNIKPLYSIAADNLENFYKLEQENKHIAIIIWFLQGDFRDTFRRMKIFFIIFHLICDRRYYGLFNCFNNEFKCYRYQKSFVE